MLPRKSSKVQPFQQQRRQISSQHATKLRSQKVLNIPKKSSARKSEKKENSSFFRIFISGTIILIILLVGTFFKKINSYHFSDTQSQTFLVVAPSTDEYPLSLVATRGSEKEVVITKLPKHAVLQSLQTEPKTIGQFVEQYENERISNEQLQRFITLELGFPVDWQIKVDSSGSLSDKVSLLNAANPFSHQLTFSHFSFWDKVKLWWYFVKTDSSRYQLTDQFLNRILEGHKNTLNYVNLSNLVQRYYADTSLLKEHPTAAVINTTSVNGLAKQIGEILSNWGYSVINLSSAQNDSKDRTLILLSAEEDQAASSNRLHRAFSFAEFKNDKPELLESYRSKIVIFVGNDLGVIEQDNH